MIGDFCRTCVRLRTELGMIVVLIVLATPTVGSRRIWQWARPDAVGIGGSGRRQTCRSTIAFFNSAISFAGLRPFGQALEQFRIVWQR